MSEHRHPNYVAIWGWLMGLAVVSLAAGALPGGRTVAAVVLFGAAGVKAVLVALNFMHLRFEPRLIYAMVLVPLLFAAILAVALVPDFVLTR
jgi:caa(3)-type oxidase subunit IV